LEEIDSPSSFSELCIIEEGRGKEDLRLGFKKDM
jgi:hypothetical protein